MAYDDNTVLLEGVEVLRGGFRNFSGRKTKYNVEGNRNFAIKLTKEQADMLAAGGWAVKVLQPLEEGDVPTPFLKVTVKYGKGKPPKVVMISSRGRTNLGEEEVGLLDWANYDLVDLIVRPYNWTVQDDTGVSAYLQSMYVTIQEDALDLKYAEVEDTTGPPVGLEFH